MTTSDIPDLKKRTKNFVETLELIFLFRPSAEEIYATDRSTFVEETSLSINAGRQIASRTLPRRLHSGREAVQHSRA